MSTSKKVTYISTDEMIKAFENFDAIAFKYGYKSMEEMNEDWERYSRIVQHEKSNQLAGLTKRNYAGDYANLNLVYGDKKQNQQNMKLIELVSNKVINEYINIPGMERLFSETYIEFEWEMHLSADYKKHNMKFYRDHFIHQIRDAYMMWHFMDKYGFYEHIKTVLENENESKVSRFVHKHLIQQKYHEYPEIRELRRTNEFYIRNLIYMAGFMAALFHDIGYPEAYYMTTSCHITDYIASLHELNEGGSNTKKIYSLLQNSLLFRVVPFEEISRKINEKKPDHGALSAVIFLLQFYENGAIYRLEPYKTAAVELAALAIYNHTNKYDVLEAKNATAYRPCFTLNPISYLLRICDDLQEWDRIYFVISNKSNPLFCNKCRTPIIGKKLTDQEGKVNGVCYECNCKGIIGHCRKEENDSVYCFSQAFDGKYGFPYRRIYNVSVCSHLEISIGDTADSQRKMCVHLRYDPYKLLHISYLHPTYAKYRITELNSVKKLLDSQRIIPQIYLDYFVTSNPIHIKVKLLEDYLKKTGDEDFTLDDIFMRGGDPLSAVEVLEKKIYEKCKPLIGKFIQNEGICKDCGYCENYIHSLKNICYENGTDEDGYLACQDEVNRRCLSALVMRRMSVTETDMEQLKEAVADNSNISKLIKEKNLRYPDFKKTCLQQKETERASIFYEKRFGTVKENAKWLSAVCPNNKMRDYLERAAGLYIRLYIYQSICKKNNMHYDKTVEDFVRSEGRKLSEKYAEYPELRCLIEDCFLQFSRMYENMGELKYYPLNYYEQYENGKRKEYLYPDKKKLYEYESEDYYYKALMRYIDAQNYKPILTQKWRGDTDYIDAYTDLYLFHLMVEEQKQ